MDSSDAAVEHAFWRAEGHPLKIEYSLSTLDEICSSVVDAFYCAPRGGVEVGGVLFGTAGEDTVRILAWRPLPCKYAGGPSYVLSPEDEGGLRQLLEASQSDLELKSFVPVGWFHSHTRSGIFLSSEDLEIYKRYFPEAWQIALVLQPGKLKPTKAGFFVREPDGSIRGESSYREFLVSPAPRPQVSAPRSKRRRRAAEPAHTDGPEDRLVEVEPPRFTMEVESPKHWKRVGVVALLLTGVICAAAGARAWWLAEPSPDLVLRVSDSNSHLRIDWDRNARVIRQATGATLEIGDGAIKKVLELDGDQLRMGSVTFVRDGDSVNVHLMVRRAGAAPVEAVTMFLGQPLKPKVIPAMEQVESASEIEDLRIQLRKEAAKSRTLQQAMKTLQRKIRAPEKERH